MCYGLIIYFDSYSRSVGGSPIDYKMVNGVVDGFVITTTTTIIIYTALSTASISISTTSFAFTTATNRDNNNR